MVIFITDDNVVASYPVAPNTTVALINVNDPNNCKMYIKSTEANGMPHPIRTFELKEVIPQKQNGEVVSRQEFDSLNQQLQNLQQMIAGLGNANKVSKGEVKQ